MITIRNKKGKISVKDSPYQGNLETGFDLFLFDLGELNELFRSVLLGTSSRAEKFLSQKCRARVYRYDTKDPIKRPGKTFRIEITEYDV